MIRGRAAFGCSSLVAVVALTVVLLPLIGLAALAGWGAILLVSARPVHPIRKNGVAV